MAWKKPVREVEENDRCGSNIVIDVQEFIERCWIGRCIGIVERGEEGEEKRERRRGEDRRKEDRRREDR